MQAFVSKCRRYLPELALSGLALCVLYPVYVMSYSFFIGHPGQLENYSFANDTIFPYVYRTLPVTIDGRTYDMQIADTEETEDLGLGDRQFLATDTGMFFVFDTPGNYGFWMKDMQFPLDIIWVGPLGDIVHIEQDLSPSTYPETYYPDVPALYVLELSAGQVSEHDIKIGDKIIFDKNALKKS